VSVSKLTPAVGLLLLLLLLLILTEFALHSVTFLFHLCFLLVHLLTSSCSLSRPFINLSAGPWNGHLRTRVRGCCKIIVRAIVNIKLFTTQ